MTDKRKTDILGVKPGDETLWAIAETERKYPPGRRRPFVLTLLLLILVYLVFAHLFVAIRDVFIIGFSPLTENWKNSWHILQAVFAAGSLAALLLRWGYTWLLIVLLSLQQFILLIINHIYLFSNVDRLRHFFFSNPPAALKLMNFAQFKNQLYLGLGLNLLLTLLIVLSVLRLKKLFRWSKNQAAPSINS